MTGTAWTVEPHSGRAQELHGLEMPGPMVRRVWPFELTHPAIALGSTQRLGVIDESLAHQRGLDVVRRRSGGGAVLLVPGELTWVDVLLPATDSRWEVDVGRSFGWLGRTWAATLAGFGVVDLSVHEGPLVHRQWSDLVCFAGLGPGEVSLGGRKAVGLSQRRTRAGARFQCAVLHRWDPVSLLDVCVLSAADRRRASEDLAEVAVGIGPIDPTELVAAFAAELGRVGG